MYSKTRKEGTDMIDNKYNGKRMGWVEIKQLLPNKMVCLVDTENIGTHDLKGTIVSVVDNIQERDNETERIYSETGKKVYWRYTNYPVVNIGVIGI